MAQKAAYTLPDGQNPHYIKIFIRSCLAYNLKLAQMAEWLRQQTCKQEVPSSIPSGAIFFCFFFNCLKLWFFAFFMPERARTLILPILPCPQYIGTPLYKLVDLEKTLAAELYPVLCKIAFKIISQKFQNGKTQIFSEAKKIFFLFFFLNSCVNLQVRS